MKKVTKENKKEEKQRNIHCYDSYYYHSITLLGIRQLLTQQANFAKCKSFCVFPFTWDVGVKTIISE